MIKTFKFRLFTNTNQERELAVCLETHRRLYNQALDGIQLCWETAGVRWSYCEQSSWFKSQRKRNGYYARLNYASAQQTLRKLERAYRRFFADRKSGRKSGAPRFKSVDRYNSFSYCLSGKGGGCKIVDGKLRLQNIGTIRVRWHRDLPEGEIKECRIVRENGKWFACFCVEIEKQATTANTNSVGIDVGLKEFATTSDGESIGDSRVLESNLKELRRRNRKLARAKRGSSTRKKTKKRVTALHAKVRNTRRDMHHKVARYLVDRYGNIAVESLNVKGMLKNRRLSRRISDAGWSSFITTLSSKAEEAGCTVILVNPKYTSQECSGCGEIVKKSLAVRIHRCGSCGLTLDRDVNAAINILGRAAPGFANSEVISN